MTIIDKLIESARPFKLILNAVHRLAQEVERLQDAVLSLSEAIDSHQQTIEALAMVAAADAMGKPKTNAAKSIQLVRLDDPNKKSSKTEKPN